MALCDFLLGANIDTNCTGYVKGAKPNGVIINRADINMASVTFDDDYDQPFLVDALPLKGGKVAYDIVQSGKTPWSGTQQELQEGTYINTYTNTVQFVILNQGSTTAEQVFALMNGEFVVIMQNNQGDLYQVYGLETGLHASAMVRELYSDDTLSGWLVTMTEENAVKGNIFTTKEIFDTLKG